MYEITIKTEDVLILMIGQFSYNVTMDETTFTKLIGRPISILTVFGICYEVTGIKYPNPNTDILSTITQFRNVGRKLKERAIIGYIGEEMADKLKVELNTLKDTIEKITDDEVRFKNLMLENLKGFTKYINRLVSNTNKGLS